MKSYITIAQLKNRIQPLTVTTYDTDFLGLIQHTSDEIDHETHRYFECREGIKYMEGSGTSMVFTDDVLSLSSIDCDYSGTGSYDVNIPLTQTIMYPLNEYPKTYIKTLSNSSYSFAGGIRAGIRLTGVFGFGDSYTATPYLDSSAVVNTGGINSSATTHALATGKGALFSPGMTLRIDSEQMYVTNVSTDTLTFTRGENGTTAAAHLAAATIYIYQYYGPVVEATLIQAVRWWKRRESAYQTKSGDATLGTLIVYKGLDDDVARIVGHVKRYPL